jgi:hypothetical protein
LAGKETRKAQAERLLEAAITRTKRPKSILVAEGALADLIRPLAVRKGLHVKPVPEYDLSAIASGPREAFARNFKEDQRLSGHRHR